MVYVDRKAELKGVQPLRGVSIEYSLEFPGAGFYWVEFVSRENAGYAVRLAERADQPRVMLTFY